MVKYIVNADDLGYNPNVNEAISHALNTGMISSSTILANSTTWDEVQQIVRNNPKASFGVHLNLTEGVALTHSEVLLQYNIVDEDNNFSIDNLRLKKERTLPQDLLDAIREEWDAQIDTIVNGHLIPVTHFDGHHHIHTTFTLRKVLLDLTKKYSVGAVRNRYNLPDSGKTLKDWMYDILNLSYRLIGFPKSRKAIVDKLMEDYLWRSEVSKVLRLTPYMSSYEYACGFIKGGKQIDNTIELMCHPGSPLYIEEMEMVNQSLFNELINGAIMVSYREIML